MFQASEWALMRKHRSEDCFGVQMAGGYADTMSLTARVRYTVVLANLRFFLCLALCGTEM